MANTFCTVCPDLCTGNVDLPALDTNIDCFANELKESQITGFIMLPSGATAPTDHTDATAWGLVIDNTNTDNTKAKHLRVEGGLPAPEKNLVELPKLNEKISNRTYEMSFVVKNLSDTNYTFLKAIQCGDTDFTFWYETLYRIFGGADGIEPSFVDVDFPLGEGREDVEQAIITVKFIACGDPPRDDNPF